MRNGLIVSALVAASLLVPLAAETKGAGGVEYFSSLDSDIQGVIPLPDGSSMDFPRGLVAGLSGFGFRFTPDGWKTGGFGTLFVAAPTKDTTLGAAGGFGGIIVGSYRQLGPFTFALNTRLGAGAIVATFVWPAAFDPMPVLTGTFALFGSIDAEAGLALAPTMMVSVYAGMNALVTFPWVIAPVAVPTMGIRITFGGT
jgi:hypothetical protein